MLYRCTITIAVYLQQPYEDCMIKNKEILFLLGKAVLLCREKMNNFVLRRREWMEYSYGWFVTVEQS